jgi:hypothetical protein
MVVRKKRPVSKRKRVAKPPYVKRAREYQKLMEQLGLNQLETGRMFEYSGRASRRYKRGDGKVPMTALILMRLMASGDLTKRQVMQASALQA